jgi:hypothetical protein
MLVDAVEGPERFTSKEADVTVPGAAEAAADQSA